MPLSQPPQFRTALAHSVEDIAAAQRLRYKVFVAELGGDGAGVDHAAGLERDRFDAFSDHLLLLDETRPPADRVVGVYRLMSAAQATAAGGFYSQNEYDLAPLHRTGRRLLELGRSCLHPDYRGGQALLHLWQGLASLIADRKIDVLFGTASFHGTDLQALAGPLSLLHAEHLAPPPLRVRAQPGHFERMDLLAPDLIDRKAALRATPALIKSYLRLGGMVGEGAFVDHAFNTTDVCMILDTATLDPRKRARFSTQSMS